MIPARLVRPAASWLVVGIMGIVAGFVASRSAVGSPPGTRPDESLGSAAPASFIDELIQTAWDKAGIKPSPVAPDAEFLRRAYLDILGRIPTSDEAMAFLSSSEKDKRARLIDELLENPDYPKNFANTWRVLLIGRRNRERQVNSEALGSWLRRQFADNRPWNEMAHELITAEGSNKENGAVNFTTAHIGERTRRGSHSAVNLTSLTTRLFLGQQIQCTQCHDHPSNSWKQADFWSINAFFKGVRIEDKTRPGKDDKEVYDYTEVHDEPTSDWSTFEKRNAIVGIAFPAFLDGRKISQGTDVNRREALGRFITEPGNIQFSRAYVNRMWGHFMGRGLVQPVDDMGDHNASANPELLDRLAREFQSSGYDTKALIRWITNSRAYRLTSVTTKANEKDDALCTHMLLKPMTPEQLFDSLLVATSAHQSSTSDETDRRRERWLDQFLFTFGADDAEEISSFQGTIPQALMMMNGELMAQATSADAGHHLSQVKQQALSQRRERPEAYMVKMLYLAAFSRFPNRSELTKAEQFLTSNPDTQQVLEDLFWSLLNSSEFVLNH